MRTITKLPIWAGLAVAALVAALAVAPVLASPTNSTGTATITVYARGAAVGQHVEVQWGDKIGGWHRVDGWTGTLDNITPQGVPFKRYTVFSSNYGQGPFRWVIYNPDGVTLWSVGPGFTLPTVDGTDLAQPFNQQFFGQAAPTPAPTGTTAPTGSAGMTGPAVLTGGERVLAANNFTFPLGCSGGNCSSSKITILVGGLPDYTWITVQWLDGAGVWHTVDGWQGTASSIDNNGVLLKQWDISPSLFGLGPFRWVLYNYQGGSLIGVSPNFYMPKTARLNFFVTVSV